MTSVSVGESPKRLSDDELEKYSIESGGNYENFEETFGRAITDDDTRRIRHIRNEKSSRVYDKASSHIDRETGKTTGELLDEQNREDASMGIMGSTREVRGEIGAIRGFQSAVSGELGDLRPEELQRFQNQAIDSLIRMKIKMMEMTGEFIPPQDAIEYSDAIKPIRENLGKQYGKLSSQEILEEVKKLQAEYLSATKKRRDTINSVFEVERKADDASRLTTIEQRRAKEESEIAAERESTPTEDSPIEPPPRTASLDSAAELNRSAQELDDSRMGAAASGSNNITTIVTNAPNINRSDTNMVMPSYSSRSNNSTPEISHLAYT
jgi:NADH dehydrogenase/NADH:ubiquinone oxidoreductase subunit G